ncbi:MAG: hypothetical protein QXD60_00990 [Nanopusillaceae archaeon]
MAAKFTLVTLIEQGWVAENTPGQRSRVLEIEVPQNRLYWIRTDQKIIFRPAFVYVGSVTLQSSHFDAGTGNILPIPFVVDQPICPPPARWQRTWPHEDGFTVKAFVRLGGATPGPWVRVNITNLDYATHTVTVQPPNEVPQADGTPHTFEPGDVLQARISYAAATGSWEFTRETPDNAVQRLSKAWFHASCAELNRRDQYGASRLVVSIVPWAPEYCLFRFYLTAQGTIDLGQVDGPGDTEYDPLLTATQVIIPYDEMDMSEAQAKVLAMAQGPGRVLRHRSLYSLFVAQLASQEPEIRAM